MRLSYQDGWFRFECVEEQSEFARLSGFHSTENGLWLTRDLFAAKRLAHYGDIYTQNKIRQASLEAERNIHNSAAVSANGFNPPSPSGLTYLDYQKAGIAYLQEHKGGLLADEMGLGKTVQAIGLINLLAVETVLIVCPASLKLNWRDEVRKWLTVELSYGVATSNYWPLSDIVIVNYELLRKCRPAIHKRKWDLLIGDEIHYCFPGYNRVLTNEGWLPIREIVDERKATHVLSCDSSGNALRWRRINERFRIPHKPKLLDIFYGEGFISCSPEHKIYVDGRGYIKAEEIKIGDKLQCLREETNGSSKESWLSILFNKLFSKVENEQTTSQGSVSKSHQESPAVESRQEATRPIKEDEEKQSYASTFGEVESVSDPSRRWSSAKIQGREWPTVTATTEDFRASLVGTWAINGLRIRNKSKVRSTFIQRAISYALQNRYCRIWSEELSNRNRWLLSQFSISKRARLEKDKVVRSFGLVSVENIERRGNDRNQTTGEYLPLYDLEIEGDHQYVCEGIRVHNCKNKNTVRAKEFFGIPHKFPLGLTGTPVPNRPLEVFSVINWLRPKSFPSYRAFKQRYEAGRNLRELHNRLRSTVMVRRLKKDVLKDLPPKRRQIIELPWAGHEEVIQKEIEEFSKREEAIKDLREIVRQAKESNNQAEYREAVRKLREEVSVAFAEMSRVRQETAVAKLPYVIKHLEDCLEIEDKVICFGYHKEVLDTIEEHFGTRSVKIHGDTKEDDRHQAVQRFQNDNTIKLFIGSFLAAGTGLTLTASSHVVFVELDWRPYVLRQAEDRAHRIGQKDSVLVQHVLFEKSLDAKMAKRIVSKQEKIDAALDGENPR